MDTLLALQMTEKRVKELERELSKAVEQRNAARSAAALWKRAAKHCWKGWRGAADIASQAITKFASHALKRTVIQYSDGTVLAMDDPLKLLMNAYERGYASGFTQSARERNPAADKLAEVIDEYLEWGAKTSSDRDYLKNGFRAAMDEYRKNKQGEKP